MQTHVQIASASHRSRLGQREDAFCRRRKGCSLGCILGCVVLRIAVQTSAGVIRGRQTKGALVPIETVNSKQFITALQHA